jgi:hypothetical protein
MPILSRAQGAPREGAPLALRERARFARLDKLKLVLQNRRCFQW